MYKLAIKMLDKMIKPELIVGGFDGRNNQWLSEYNVEKGNFDIIGALLPHTRNLTKHENGLLLGDLIDYLKLHNKRKLIAIYEDIISLNITFLELEKLDYFCTNIKPDNIYHNFNGVEWNRKRYRQVMTFFSRLE